MEMQSDGHCLTDAGARVWPGLRYLCMAGDAANCTQGITARHCAAPGAMWAWPLPDCVTPFAANQPPRSAPSPPRAAGPARGPVGDALPPAPPATATIDEEAPPHSSTAAAVTEATGSALPPPLPPPRMCVLDVRVHFAERLPRSLNGVILEMEVGDWRAISTPVGVDGGVAPFNCWGRVWLPHGLGDGRVRFKVGMRASMHADLRVGVFKMCVGGGGACVRVQG